MEVKRAAKKAVQKKALKRAAVAKKAGLALAASVLPKKADATDLSVKPAKFIRQSFRSNYCGVYATGMFLSLLGVHTTRERALNLFKLKRSNPSYKGTNHREIGKVLCGAAQFGSLRWRYYKHFDFAALSASLINQLKTSGPTLLSFGAIHKTGKWKCTHVVVVIGVKGNRLELVDPLAKPPLRSSGANVSLAIASRQPVKVLGSSYSINLKSETAVLRWAVRRPHAKNRNK